MSSCIWPGLRPAQMGCVPERPFRRGLYPGEPFRPCCCWPPAGVRRTRQHGPPAEYRAGRSLDCSPECVHGTTVVGAEKENVPLEAQLMLWTLGGQ